MTQHHIDDHMNMYQSKLYANLTFLKKISNYDIIMMADILEIFYKN